MATDKFPQQNVNMPMSQDRVDAARAKLTPPRAGTQKPAPSNGNGSRREVRPGEWFDDRRIEIGGPSSKSKDSPRSLAARKAGRCRRPTIRSRSIRSSSESRSYSPVVCWPPAGTTRWSGPPAPRSPRQLSTQLKSAMSRLIQTPRQAQRRRRRKSHGTEAAG